MEEEKQMMSSNNWTWGNDSEPPPMLRHRGMEVLAYIDVISSPLICLVGTFLNLMAVGAFLSKPLRRISCCLYLATRSLAVFGFLVSMATAWSNTFTTLIRTEGICEMTVFLSYFCPFLSVWMVVVISLENFIRIAQPSRVSTLCNPRVAHGVIATFCIMGLAVYNFPLWTSRVINGHCNVRYQFVQLVLIFNYVDTALTLLAPFALLIILVPLVALTAIHAFDRKKRLAAGRLTRPGAQEVKSTPEARVTHLLLAVSVVFLLLHTPFHAIRIKYFILTLANAQITEIDSILHQIFRLFYNLDTCVSCAVYLIFGDNFRRVFCDLYFSRCRRWCKKSNIQDVNVTTTTATHTHHHSNSTTNNSPKGISVSNLDNISQHTTPPILSSPSHYQQNNSLSAASHSHLPLNSQKNKNVVVIVGNPKTNGSFNDSKFSSNINNINNTCNCRCSSSISDCTNEISCSATTTTTTTTTVTPFVNNASNSCCSDSHYLPFEELNGDNPSPSLAVYDQENESHFNTTCGSSYSPSLQTCSNCRLMMNNSLDDRYDEDDDDGDIDDEKQTKRGLLSAESVDV